MADIPLLRTSERTDFKRCIFRWNLRYNEYLVPISLSSGPLWFGTGVHIALAEWYTNRVEPQETWAQFARDSWDTVRTEKFVDDDIEGDWVDAISLGDVMLKGYREEYGKDEQWEILYVEQPFAQYISNPNYPERTLGIPGNRTVHQVRENTPIVQYVGRLDLIVRDHEHNGRIRYVDHKTARVIETEHLTIDDQNGGYLAIGTHQLRQEGIIGPKEAVRDLVYNFLRKAKPDDRPKNRFGESLNKDGTVSKRQPIRNFERYVVTKTSSERNQQIRKIGDEALHMKAIRTGKLPLIKTPRRECRWDCNFFNLCQVHESEGDVDEVKKMLFRREDPYAEYQAEIDEKSKETK
jgi:Zierdtviridae exonuclease